MFGQKKVVESLETDVADLEGKLDNALSAEAKAVEELADARDEIERLAERDLRKQEQLDQFATGKFKLPGESLNTDDLIRVLREELACTHDELKALREAIKASQTLLKPHLGE